MVQDVFKGTEEEARRQREEMRVEKLREKSYNVEDEPTERAKADREAAALRFGTDLSIKLYFFVSYYSLYFSYHGLLGNLL